MIPIWKRLRLLGALAAVALVACAPIVYLPPPVAMAPGEALAGGSLVGGLYKVQDGAVQESLQNEGYRYADVMLWAGGPLNDWVTLGVTANYGKRFLGAGVSGTLKLVHADRFTLGLQVGGGFLHGMVGVPIGVGLTDRLWLYTTPNITARPIDDGGGIMPPNFNNFTTEPYTPQLPFGVYWMSPGTIGFGLEVGDILYVDREPGEHAPYVALSVGFLYRPEADGAGGLARR